MHSTKSNPVSRNDDMLAMQVGLEWTLEIADEGIYIHNQPSQFRQKSSVPTKKIA